MSMPPPNATTESHESSSAMGGLGIDELRARTEDYARQEPMQAVGAAFVAGLILTFLPVGTIIAGILRLALALVRPALVVLGAVKVYEEVNKRQQS